MTVQADHQELRVLLEQVVYQVHQEVVELRVRRDLAERPDLRERAERLVQVELRVAQAILELRVHQEHRG